MRDLDREKRQARRAARIAAAKADVERIRNRVRETHERPGYTGARVLGPIAEYVFAQGVTSRADFIARRRRCGAPHYMPHQGAREMERRRRRMGGES